MIPLSNGPYVAYMDCGRRPYLAYEKFEHKVTQTHPFRKRRCRHSAAAVRASEKG